MGRNGSGKSTLLKIIQGLVESSAGDMHVPDDVVFSFVPQLIEECGSSSGGEQLKEALTQALAFDPNVLLLDEPTNHLDLRNRRSLMRMLKHYKGTLIIASHDTEVLRTCVDILWHIENGKIQVFHGNYDNYMCELSAKRASLDEEFAKLDRQKRAAHLALMKEQSRAQKRRAQGEKRVQQRKWPTLVSSAKARRAQETSGNKKKKIAHLKQTLLKRRSELYVPEVVKPKFLLPAASCQGKSILFINEGRVEYDQMILTNISLNAGRGDRVALIGNNGSGKSTLFKAIRNDSRVTRTGNWVSPKPCHIGYLDQHYLNLDDHKTVFESIEEAAPLWSTIEIRRHLNDFLFSKNTEVNMSVRDLSGGEKARLSLAQIASMSTSLLLLDEITNNLDMETRDHMIQVLKQYPGCLMVISHDAFFLDAIDITQRINIQNFSKGGVA